MIGLVPGRLLGAVKPTDPTSMHRRADAATAARSADGSRAPTVRPPLHRSPAAAERDKGGFAWGGRIRGQPPARLCELRLAPSRTASSEKKKKGKGG
jgi:hypothetical protein